MQQEQSRPQKNTDVMIQYQRLKKQYDEHDGQIEKREDGQHMEDELNESNLLLNIQQFSSILACKLNELKMHNEQITKLHAYKQDIVDVLIRMKSIEDTYVNMFQKNTFIDLAVTRPMPKAVELLSCEYRGNVKLDNTTSDLSWVTSIMFMFKDEYIESMYKTCEKIDTQILTKLHAITKVTNYINTYKRVLKSCGNVIDHKICNKFQCTICYENEINVCLMPCGHTFCTPCSEKLKKKCFACNGAVTETTKLYMLGNDDATQTTAEYDFEPLPNPSSPQLERWFLPVHLQARFSELT